MLQHLRIGNFKSWEEVDMPLAPLTGIFGTNSSGKTSLLQFLLMLKQTVESADRKQVLNFGDERTYVELGGWSDVIFKHEVSRTLDFSLKWKLPKELVLKNPLEPSQSVSGQSLKFDCELEYPESKKLQVRKFTYSLDGQEWIFEKSGDRYKLNEGANNSFKLKRNIGRKWPFPPPIRFYGFPEQLNAYYQNAGFLSDLQLELENMLNGIYYLGPLRDFPRRQYKWSGGSPGDMGFRGEKFVDAILASKQRNETISRGRGKKKLTLEELVAEWLQNMGLIDSFRVEKIKGSENLYHVRVRKSAHSPEVSLTDVGFGVSQVLPVITLCFYVPEGSVVILEQPEIHLHPRVQANLADVILDAIRHRNIQVIIESHSEHLLRRIQRRIAEEEFSHENARLYFCKMENSASVLEPLQLDLYGTITNWPDGFFGNEMDEIAAMQEAMLERKMQNGNASR